LFCNEYGWTVEQVFDSTKEQIGLLVGSIMKRKQADIKFQADLHGAEMKSGSKNDVVLDEKNFDSSFKKMGINVVEE